MNRQKLFHWILAIILTSSFLLTNISSVEAAAVTNDRYSSNQTHLRQIKADRAWKVANSNTALTIAVLDSGVDLTHPDLKDNLLPGVNLIRPGKSIQDDNGHGTMVTGILAAKGNNGIGVSGVLWNARILPIKVLDNEGRAKNADKIAQGIEVAIARGAKIILMSFESKSTSKRLEDAVNMAEAQGVVLVAAAGNDSERVGYPAAYPTVIAVGATDNDDKPYYTNFGPELKIMAPGKSIYATRLGGKYGTMSGTSMAAPQVAGAVALILAKYPKMSPFDVRQLLFQTATDLGEPGWDRRTGYGLLNISKALHAVPSVDFNEPNNSQVYAKAFPIESQLRAQLSDKDTVDWYYMDVPYEGKVTLSATISSRASSPLSVSFFPENKPASTYYMENGETLSVTAKAGRMYLKMERSGILGTFSYILTSKFQINPDRYERNNDMQTARPLVGNQISVVGNFHEPGDEDWFSYYVREPGKLNVTVTTDTNRIDPVLSIVKGGIWDKPYDSGTMDDPTERAVKEVTPGKYYILVTEYWRNAVNGEYKLNVDYTPQKVDTNEPNDSSRLASRLLGGNLMTGTLPSRTDMDWFQFDVAETSYVSIQAPMIPVSYGVTVALYSSQNLSSPLVSESNAAELSDAGREILGRRLGPGKYYIRLNSSVPFKYDAYRLVLSKEKLIEGYRDITYHWARYDIARLSNKGIVNGFDDATFRPDSMVTRAQFATMLIQAMKAKGLPVGTYTGSNPFSDISRSHWAYSNITMAYRLGILQGYPNGSFKPNQPLKRAEMAVMVARAQNALLYKRSHSSYGDVPTSHWASPAIEALTSRGWLKGYKGDSFKPNAYARRAEMVVLLAKAYNL